MCFFLLIFLLTDFLKARSSGGERYLDAVEVSGSKPPVPTIIVNSEIDLSTGCLLYQWTGIKSPLLDTILGKGDYISLKEIHMITPSCIDNRAELGCAEEIKDRLFKYLVRSACDGEDRVKFKITFETIKEEQ